MINSRNIDETGNLKHVLPFIAVKHIRTIIHILKLNETAIPWYFLFITVRHMLFKTIFAQVFWIINFLYEKQR